jgi:hypothetical protein
LIPESVSRQRQKLESKAQLRNASFQSSELRDAILVKYRTRSARRALYLDMTEALGQFTKLIRGIA